MEKRTSIAGDILERRPAAPGSPPRVLIVDCRRTAAMELEQTFESAGFAPTLCDSIAGARNALAAGTFSLVIVHVLLPDGDGLDLFREIKLRPPPVVPVVLLSTELSAKHPRIPEELLSRQVADVEARAAREIAQARAGIEEELERKNNELNAFTYAVSHDLRAPLRAITGFTQALLDDFGAQLPPGALLHIQRVQRGGAQMARLIEALLELSRTSGAELHRAEVDLTALAHSAVGQILESVPSPNITWVIDDGLKAEADIALAKIVLTNLLGNAAKYTARAAHPEIHFGAASRSGRQVFFVRDNGVGFDSRRAKRLFEPFQRMHTAADFPGAGLGLATVRRIIERHEGAIWAESAVGKGATFFFTLVARRTMTQAGEVISGCTHEIAN